jgi:hypothetical protein
MVVYYRIIKSSSVIIEITKYIIKWDILDMMKLRSIILRTLILIIDKVFSNFRRRLSITLFQLLLLEEKFLKLNLTLLLYYVSFIKVIVELFGHWIL